MRPLPVPDCLSDTLITAAATGDLNTPHESGEGRGIICTKELGSLLRTVAGNLNRKHLTVCRNANTRVGWTRATSQDQFASCGNGSSG